VPYGKPLANQSFHVLSADLEPCPVGVAGELFIGGIGVAREYYRDAERTAASFIRHPRFGTRLYHTGDVGRYLPDGNIEFIGRIDHQVKVRGFRIELGEIEAVLSAQPEIASAVVTVLRDPSNVQQLVAYLLLEDAATRSADAAAVLRRRLAAQLPSYMVPSYYVVLDRWPLSSNNKLDRKQLPPPPWRSVSAELQRPVDATEQVLLEIWQQVLQATQLGTEQNFFEAGGTSMHLIEIANRANFRLQLDLSVVSYFEHPTIASLARFIQQRSVKPQAATARREPGRLADRRARRK
jgi:hypothetical protein